MLNNQMVYIHCWNAQKENTSTPVEQNAPSISKVQALQKQMEMLMGFNGIYPLV